MVFLACLAAWAQPYDLLLKGGHVIDPKNGIDAVMDVGISGGKIAKVAKTIAESEAKRVAPVAGLYVIPGLIDIHAHVYAGTGIPKVLTGDSSVYPDGFSFRSGVTTQVDAGTSGWRNFPDFKQRVIDRAQTRVLAMINIAGGGMGTTDESDREDMNAEATAKMAAQHKDIVVGIKTAHFRHSDWTAVERAVQAAEKAGIFVMVDFGNDHPERPIGTLFTEKLRPGDIYTHCFSGLRKEMVDGKLNPAFAQGRKRGIFFDIGHGGGSFRWSVAMQAAKEGFWADSISTDLHTGSMNAGMKDMTNVMSKVLNMGAPLAQVVRMSTWNAASEIRRTELGHLSEGADADVTVLGVEKGTFGFIDSFGSKAAGDRRIVAEMTIRGGRIMWDLNGRAAPDWRTVPANYRRPR
jgi:dihydroorotase